MLKSLIAFGLTAALMTGTAAYAEPETTKSDVWERGCGDDDGNDRCAADTQRLMRTAYRIEDANSLVRAGVVLRRAMIVDGYGNDLIAVTFHRKPGSAPQVDLRVPCGKDQACPAPLKSYVPIATWDRALRQSNNFDQKLVREAVPGEERSICLHAWLVVVEAVDPARAEQHAAPAQTLPGTIRTDTEGGCTDGLAAPYAFELAELALQSLPECSHLRPDWFRNTSTLLATCARLGGDRFAASEAYGLTRQLTQQKLDLGSIGQLFGFDGQQRAMQFIDNAKGGRLYLDPPFATDQDNASANGKLYFNQIDGVDEEADVKATFVRRFGSFTIETIEVGPRRKR